MNIYTLLFFLLIYSKTMQFIVLLSGQHSFRNACHHRSIIVCVVAVLNTTLVIIVLQRVTPARRGAKSVTDATTTLADARVAGTGSAMTIGRITARILIEPTAEAAVKTRSSLTKEKKVVKSLSCVIWSRQEQFVSQTEMVNIQSLSRRSEVASIHTRGKMFTSARLIPLTITMRKVTANTPTKIHIIKTSI